MTEYNEEFALEKLVVDFSIDDVETAKLGDLPSSTKDERTLLSNFYQQATIIQGPPWEEPPSEWVPMHNLQAADNIGGSTLVAYVNIDDNGKVVNEGGNPRVIGMLYETPGFDTSGENLKVFMYSHLMATDPDVKNKIKGIGFKLKVAQREANLEKRMDEVHWTYDPLQSINANVNVRKCGIVISSYHRESYDLIGISEGIAADRFKAVWKIGSERVEDRMENQSYLQQDGNSMLAEATPVIDSYQREQDEFRMVSGYDLNLDDAVVSVEIPTNFQDMINLQQQKVRLGIDDGFFPATDWRTKTGEIFENYFSKGYVVRDFVLDNDRAFYILEKGFEVE